MMKYFILIFFIVIGLFLSFSIHTRMENKDIYAVLILVVDIWLISIVLIKNAQQNIMTVYFVHFFILYILLILDVQFYDIYINSKLASFDLDKDTVFSISEQTEEQKKYFNIVINDTGRNLVFIWGFAFSLISLFVFAFIMFSIKMFKKIMFWIGQ